MFTNTKRAVVVCLVGVLLNECLSLIARLLNLPMWLDTTGTIYSSILLGFPYGFLVGLVNNLFWTIFTDGYNSFAYYIVSLAIAYASSKLAYPSKKITPLTFLKLFLILSLLGSALSSLTAFIVDNGIPTDYWSRYLMIDFISFGSNSTIACVIGITIIKVIDTLFSLLIVLVALKCTPLKYRDDEFVLK